MDVTVIIVNYNTKQITQDCINSVFEQTRDVEYEVILVDNDSHDGSKELFSNNKRIIFIESGDNLGFGKANNLGLRYAKGKYIFFLNSDTLLLNNAIYEFWRYSEEHKDDMLGGIGCILCDAHRNRCHSYARLTTWKDALKSFLIAPFSSTLAQKAMGKDAEDESKDSIVVGYVTGADLFVNRNVLDGCGAFDPDFFMYSEEIELQWRFKKHGYTNVVIHTPKIMHLEGKSQPNLKSPSMRKIMMTQKSLILYIKKTSNRVQYIAFRLLFPFTRLPFILFANRSLKDKIAYLKLILS